MTTGVSTRCCPGGSSPGAAAAERGARPVSLTSSFPEHLRHEEGHLQRLLVVEPRVDERRVPARERGVVDLLAAAEHLGDVVTGQLDVQTARHRAEALVDLEEAADLVDDVTEAPGLVAVGGGDAVAVHRVAHPG